MTWVQLNDALVPAGEARVSVFDRGFMYGDGVFDTVRVYDGHPFQLGRHLERLQGSASAIGLELPRSLERIARDVRAVLDGNGLARSDAVVRVSVSRGVGGRGLSTADSHDPTYVVAPYPVPDRVAETQASGIRLRVVETRRVRGDALPAGAKHANYLNSILAYRQAQVGGADDALLLNSDGDLAECASSNLFLVSRGRVRTPDVGCGILPGCARALILELCGGHGLEFDEARLDPSALDSADEVFVTNSVWEVVPVRAVDDREYHAPGPTTRTLAELYRRGVEAEIRESRGRQPPWDRPGPASE